MYDNDVDIIVSTTLPTIDRLTTYKNGWDALLLYFRYVRQARLQKTNTTYSNDVFMAKWMGWSKDKFYKVKKILVENALIEGVMRKSADGKVEGAYVKVNFLIGNTTTLLKNGSLEKPESGKSDTNAWSILNINAWSNKKKQAVYDNKQYTIQEAVDYIYQSYSNKVPKEKAKYNKSAQAKGYIEQLLKEYSMADLVDSAKQYFRVTDRTYIMASQYFYSNTMKWKQYRVFVDHIKEGWGETKGWNEFDASIF